MNTTLFADDFKTFLPLPMALDPPLEEALRHVLDNPGSLVRPRMGQPDRQPPLIGRLVGRLLDPGDKLLHREPGTQRGRLAHQFTPKNRAPLLYVSYQTGIRQTPTNLSADVLRKNQPEADRHDRRRGLFFKYKTES